MSYQPGSHLIATLTTANITSLQQHKAFAALINALIVQHQLQKLGEVYHDFAPSGFTAVVCLSESHLSVHTWPEHRLVNLDIYLSNYLRVNDGVVQQLFEAVVKYFDAAVEKELLLKR